MKSRAFKSDVNLSYYSASIGEAFNVVFFYAPRGDFEMVVFSLFYFLISDRT